MKISLLGVGLIGQPIALRLAQCGHDLWVWNRSPEPLRRAAKAGLEAVPDLAAAIGLGEVILLTLSDAAAIESVLLAPGITPLLKDKCVVQMGTIAPGESRAIAERVNGAGGVYLEAPVLGSIPEARAGRLIVMVAGPEPAYQHCLLMLRCLGKQVEYIGAVGQAAATKLAMNQLIASLTAGFSQSLGLIRAEGVEVERFMGLLRESALYAPTFDKKLQKFLQHDYSNPNFPLKHLIKDTGLFLRVAEEAGIDGAIGKAMLEVFQRGEEAGHGEEDYSSLYEVINPGFAGKRDSGC